jgi:hypothetical protein
MEERDRFRGMMWCCWRLRSGWGGSVPAGRRKAERRRRKGARRRRGPVVLVEEIGIGSPDELRWVTAVLLVLWIGDGKQR